MAVWVRILPAITLFAAVALLGCGDGEGEEASGSSERAVPLTRADFLEQAEEICDRQRNTSRRISLYMGANSKPGRDPSEQFADALKAVLLARIENENDALGELPAPPRDKARIEAFLDAQRKAIETVAGLPSLPGVYDAKKIFVRPDRMARRIGLTECVNARAFGGYEG
jgi:hypothetical protein